MRTTYEKHVHLNGPPCVDLQEQMQEPQFGGNAALLSNAH